MQLSRTPKTSDYFGRYYTQADVASLLVESMRAGDPRIAIDLGAGDGALVSEASRHWNRAEFVTVDIDHHAESSTFRDLRGPAFTHHTVDALDSHLAERIGLRYGHVDSGLCNPPYVRPRWRKHFAEILEDAGLSHVVPKIGAVQADVLFIAQNLRFLRRGGKLGLILPDGVVAGEKYAKLRQTLATAHTLERVIELPRRVFRNTDAKAHIVVLTKHRQEHVDIQVQCLKENGLLTAPICLDPERAAARLDYSYLAALEQVNARESGTTLRSVTQMLTRGSHSSSQLKLLSYPVFHTTDFVEGSVEVPRQFRLAREARKVAAGGVVAVAGDILLARVGRNLEQKVGVVNQGAIAVSDCILVLRVEPAYQARALQYFTSTKGRATLRATSHGVGAKFITTDSLLRLEI
ncbi:N-6 DNA methylase [Variovorax sp. J22P240]|uniref:N-6 DNA methylase n=1 Tax=Variovorax sp. J22P240 TaxID=3053514 RepID=UPI0025760E07|nr:N-6 DNA methylase [Variovorax sp. J22P240]MDM0002984.1 N-6 DNA methylase [Variovorax sp. J22P240]